MTKWAHSVSTTALCKLGFFPTRRDSSLVCLSVEWAPAFKNFFFTGVIVDLQCCVSFRRIAKWLCYTCTGTHPFLRSFSRVGRYRVLTYFWPCWVLTAACAVSSCSVRALLLQLTVSGVPRLSCLMARGIFPGQRSNPCLRMGSWTVNHWTTREAPWVGVIISISKVRKQAWRASVTCHKLHSSRTVI